jgi:cell division transport system ATP-binding protein
MSDSKVISIRNLNVYQGNNLVLSKINLDVEAGEFIFLIGKTGSGKSSLMKMLYADLELKEGEIEVAGFTLGQLKRSQVPFLRRKQGIVFQDFQLLSDRTVMDNLYFVMRATGWDNKTEMEKRGMDVLGKVGLSNKAGKMPHELSGGEQQRVAIARALLNNPTLILADEPTGNLDPDTSEEIIQLLYDISKSGTTVLVATHDYNLFRNIKTRIIRFEQGTITDSHQATA